MLVLKDKGFSLRSNPAKKARSTAGKLLEWSSDNKITIDHFSQSLVATLQSCFEDQTMLTRVGKQQERTWCKYHQVRISESFVETCVLFLKTAVCKASPIIYQYVTDFIMEQLIKLRYPIATVESNDKTSVLIIMRAMQYGTLQASPLEL